MRLAAERIFRLSAGVLMGLAVAAWLRFALSAITFPYSLGYTEGVVWQQALLIPGPRMFGDISHYPYIGFVYTPLFHVLAKALATISGSFLSAGRTVSMAATVACCAGCAWLTWSATRQFVTAALAACLPITLLPVYFWSASSTADMLGAAFGIAGLCCAVAALRRPWMLVPAVLCCVAAVFTKQIFLAAAIAIAVTFLPRAPLRTLAAYALGGLVGGAATLWLEWLTDGGFLRHILLYNVNRYELAHLASLMTYVLKPSCVVALFAMAGAGLLVRRLLSLPGGVLGALRGPGPACVSVLLLAWLVGATGEALLVGKRGAAANYFVDVAFAASCLAAIGLTQLAPALPRIPRAVAGLLCPGLITLQGAYAIFVLTGLHGYVTGAEVRGNGEKLLREVRDTPGPVLSDDLVLLLEAGKQAPIDPFLFVELSNAGLWDQRPFVDMITQRKFGAIVTQGGPGETEFDQRFSAQTQAAMLAAYPVVTAIGNMRIRRPR